MILTPLPRSFFLRPTPEVAQELLGKYLVRMINDKRLVGKIVETESYTSEDPACHAFKGKTERTYALFEQVGRAYVYFVYGNHHCFNAVAREKTEAGGVLIRAVEPVEGIAVMKEHRGGITGYNMTNGPGKLAQAFAIDNSLYSYDLTREGALYLAECAGIKEHFIIKETTRIGISKAQDLLHRFYIVGSPWVSKL